MHGRAAGRADNHLNTILENRGAFLLKFIDMGDYCEPTYHGPHVADLREWSELYRRLTIPYYEQARLFWGRARAEGLFDGMNELSLYTEKFLREIVSRFASGNAA